jgi:site-specific DNA recombinase
MSQKRLARSGQTSFGFRRVNGQLSHDPKEAPILKHIFELFFEHQRKKTVAEILNAEGHRTRSGSEFSGQTVGRLLTKDIVTGIKGELEPLIPQDLYDNVQSILAMQKGQAKRKPNHLFAGLTHCGCGGKMYVPSNSHKYVCKVCKAKIHKHDLEAVFIDQLKTHHAQSKNAQDLLKLLDRWSILTDADKRAILESTTKDITIERNLVTLSLVTLYKT